MTTGRAAAKPVNVFCSYSHRDESFRQELVNHLALLQRQGEIEAWDDRMISPGESWETAIHAQLDQADIVLLLISSDFTASEYCMGVELERALELHRSGTTLVIPIIIRPVDWSSAPFAHLQALPRDGVAVTMWPNRDEAFSSIVGSIRQVIASRQPVPSPEPTIAAPVHELGGPRTTGPSLKAPQLYNLKRQEPLVGRAAQAARIVERLTSDSLITLVGTGGCGKTSLAIAVAWELAEDLEDGVCVVELAPIHEPSLVPQTIAKALELQEQADRPPTQALAEFFAEKRMLLVLDNCEHVLEACAEITREILAKGPYTRILATSRQRLDLRGEHIEMVEPLEIPGIDHLRDLEDPDKRDRAMACDAVALFLRCAEHRLGKALAITRETVPSIIKVCQRLDGIPLALQLAAAQIDVYTVEELADRIDHAFRLLQQSRTAAGIEHHRTLTATLDWSYELLSDDLKILFRRLAVFSSSFTPDAVAAICLGGTVDEIETRRRLQALVNRSLISTREKDGKTLLYLLAIVREYGREKLTEADELAATRAVHGKWYTSFAEAAKTRLLEADQGRHLAHLELEHPNLRAALRWSLESNSHGYAFRLGAALWRFWEIKGYFNEGRRRLSQLLNSPRLNISEYYEIISGLGLLAYRQGDYAVAEKNFSWALDEARTRDDQKSLANALNDMALIRGAQKRHGDALTFLAESHQIEIDLGNQRGIAVSLNNLGYHAIRTGQVDRAKGYFQESAERFEAMGNHWESGYPLFGLGRTYLDQADYDTAHRYFAMSHDRRQAVDDKRNMGRCLDGLAKAQAGRGNLAQAGDDLIRSLELLREVNDGQGVAGSLATGAMIAANTGDLAAGVRLAAAAGLDISVTEQDDDTSVNRDIDPRWHVRQARQMLSPDAYSAAWRSGESLSVEQAIHEIKQACRPPRSRT